MRQLKKVVAMSVAMSSLALWQCSDKTLTDGTSRGKTSEAASSKGTPDAEVQTSENETLGGDPAENRDSNATTSDSTDPVKPPVAAPSDSPNPNYRIAFVGDQGAGVNTQAVLGLIKAANVNLMVVLGDFDYSDNPDAWDKSLTDTLGDAFPVIAAVGNHDTAAWTGYKAKLTTRLAKLQGIKCEGDYGVNMKCSVPGITLALSGVGTLGTGHEAFLDKTLAEAKTPWKVCNWHKNQRKLQVGAKTDEVGYLAYNTCLKYGAFVATGHEHSYERTHLLSNMETQAIASTSSNLVLEPGKSFAFVSGLGGKEVRDQELSGDFWAKIYTSNQAAKFGVLLCDFNVDNNPRKARCQFKNTANEIIDDFTIESRIP